MIIYTPSAIITAVISFIYFTESTFVFVFSKSLTSHKAFLNENRNSSTYSLTIPCTNII